MLSRACGYPKSIDTNVGQRIEEQGLCLLPSGGCVKADGWQPAAAVPR